MGPSAIKLLTGTRLGSTEARVPKDKLSRLRSAIHKFSKGLVAPEEAEHYILRLMGQLRFIHQVCPRDASNCAKQLALVCDNRWLDGPSKKFLAEVI